MCYSNSSTSSNVQLSERYKKQVPSKLEAGPVFFANGFSFPNWRIITSDPEIKSMRWGLVPSWFSGSDWREMASMTLNARIETVDEKASFCNLIDRQRCIVPSTGFFEWKHIGKEKVPYFICSAGNNVFSIAGLYDQWKDPLKGKIVHTFSILTGEANALMRKIHNSKFRMPVLLSHEQENDWLSGNLDYKVLLVPKPDSLMKAHEISKKIIGSDHANCMEVSHPFNNGIYEQGSLF